MKQAGVPENDPELIKARNILESIQRKTDMLKRQQAYRQQQLKQQQQQQQQQQQAALQQNGAPSQSQMNGAGMVQPPIPDNQNQTPQNMTPGPFGASSAMNQPGSQSMSGQVEGAGDASMSKDQVEKLRYQMKAFAALQKNMPIPQGIQDRIFPSRQ
jgi:ATP-dependent helicase STH1/SNF2